MHVVVAGASSGFIRWCGGWARAWWTSASARATKRSSGAGTEPRVYAESILKTCQFYVESPLVCVTGVTGSDLKKRIEQIMRGQSTVRLGTPKTCCSRCCRRRHQSRRVVGAATAPATRGQSSGE